MNSRQRLIETINHRHPDRVPLDLGATSQTGISASVLYKLRKSLGLVEKPITIIEPMQMLGKVEDDIMQALGVDVVGLFSPYNIIGYKNSDWKQWTMPDSTPVFMGGDYKYEIDKEGSILVFPQGDMSANPSMKMLKDGSFFDNITRGNEDRQNGEHAREDFKELYSNTLTQEIADYFERQSTKLYQETQYGIVLNFNGGSFGDSAVIPGPSEKNPKGLRSFEDWLMAYYLCPDYVHEVFEMQAETALKNLEILKQSCSDRVQVVTISGTDFGTQRGEIFSLDIYRTFYKPYHKKLNDWVHTHTNWKTFYHTCGAVYNFIPDFIEAGVDIMNPVQTSASGMEAQKLKSEFGNRLVFWGGGIDTQKTLPYGTAEEVKKEVKNNLEIFSPHGGYVFNTVHNIVANTPIDNLTAMYGAVTEYNNAQN